jgi:voltage-gated potassium channel
MTIKEKIFRIIEKAEKNDKASKFFDSFLIILIILNIISIILESFNSLSITYHNFFKIFEIFSVIIFSIEYLLRLFTSDLKYPNVSKMQATIKYIFSMMAVFDLFAILPFYLPMIIPIDLRFLRILRLTRILRIMKIQRYNNSLSLIANVIRRKKSDIIVTLFITFLLLLLSSSIMYYVETKSQPESFPNIIASFWWAIATLTRVGYGDVFPVTVLGKILSGIIALLGIGIVALPTGIISSGFIELLEEGKKEIEEENCEKSSKKKYCPYCGNDLNK